MYFYHFTDVLYEYQMNVGLLNCPSQLHSESQKKHIVFGNRRLSSIQTRRAEPGGRYPQILRPYCSMRSPKPRPPRPTPPVSQSRTVVRGQRRPTSVFFRVAPATGALDGERRGCFSTPRPTLPPARTRPVPSAKCNKRRHLSSKVALSNMSSH